MLERIKKDKLKFATIVISILVFIVGIVMTIVNSGDTYALTYEDYECSLGGGIPVYGEISDDVYGYYCSIENVEVATTGFAVGTSLEEDAVCESYLNKIGYSHVISGAGYYCTYVAKLKQNTISYYSNKPSDELEEDMDGNKSDFIFSESVARGSMYTIPSSATPKREGYKFLGWSLDKNSTEAGFVVGAQVAVLEDMNFYAVWEKEVVKYEISFYTNKTGDDENDWLFTDYAEYKSMYTIPSSSSLTREHYTFLGWSLDKNKIEAGFVAGDQVAVLEDMRFYAIWEAKDYEVSFYSNKTGDDENDWLFTNYAEYGSMYTIPSSATPTREGYNFLGWNTNKTALTVEHNVGGQVSVIGNVNLYAIWELINDTGDNIQQPDVSEPGVDNPDTKIEYTVDYNANGGVGTTQSSTHTYGESKKLTANGFSRTGYSFVGWATSSNGSVVYSDKEEVTNLSSTNGAIVTLYAVWDANTYKIDYKLNGGVISGNPTSGTYGEDVIIKNPTKTITIVGNDNKTGATISDNISVEQKFTGWTSSTIDTNSAYYDDTAWINGNTKVTSTVFRNLATVDGTMVTLIANWDKFDVTLPTVTKEGYNCSWNLKPDGSGDGYESGEVVTGLTNSATSVNLYAICESGSKTDNELDKGPQTGSTLIYAVWIIGAGALGYSVYYFMKKRNEM